MSGSRLADRRVLVVGASAGLGQATARAIAAEGARVAIAARRRPRLEACLATLPRGAVALECDVAEDSACERVVAETVSAFGGLEAVVYAPGLTILRAARDTTGSDWRETFETNLFGAAMVTRAALPHLLESRGRVVYFSSISIDDRPPRAGMSAYVASKVALESMAQAFQGEHPSVGFTTIAAGDTLTEKVAETPPEVAMEFVPRWMSAGLLPGRLMDAESVAEQVVNVLASREHVRRLAITPEPPAAAGAVEIPGVAGNPSLYRGEEEPAAE
ncbi:MAG: SDR family oxidoreductase [Spirochaetaceae bacterium]|nr:SDR family oxidoreductase [Myxococcales bacterium]MCB9724998.1 SDR family oxidoreductase [Spirochaetaceae bacterium]HPG24542.1 SDR family oxidoreductase [Myxococcota bacterium]